MREAIKKSVILLFYNQTVALLVRYFVNVQYRYLGAVQALLMFLYFRSGLQNAGCIFYFQLMIPILELGSDGVGYDDL